MKRYCLAVDLVDDPALIAEYEEWHTKEKAWPEIMKSITDSGITNMPLCVMFACGILAAFKTMKFSRRNNNTATKVWLYVGLLN